MKQVLFVSYGSGHIKMLIPVAQALQASGLAHPVVLALTTAAPVARAAGLDVRQFKDFLEPCDEDALAHGLQLMSQLGSPVADAEETTAYLGLSYADLVERVGPAEAKADYQRRGRQAFLPVRTLERILARLKPELVVATNSPRAERAAILAARKQGIPAVCVVDLFAIEAVRWIGEPDYADHVCVLNTAVRDFLLASGRRPEQVTVTGNPGFDALNTPQSVQDGQRLREQQGWTDKSVILWPVQTEPAVHPFDGRPGNPELPGQALQTLIGWVLAHEQAVLCIRVRAGEQPPPVPVHPRIVVSGQDWPLPAVLHATQVVVTFTSTVGLEGHMAGCHLIQVKGSLFDEAMPLARYGIADEAVPVHGIPAALDRWIAVPRRPAQILSAATQNVLSVLIGFL